MALVLRNTRELIKPENFKAKLLVYALNGVGKTSFLGTAENSLIGACETGEGNGLLSIAGLGRPYTELNSYADFEVFCSGAFTKQVEKDGMRVDTEGLDSLSDMARTFIKDHALTFPRNQGNSPTRNAGIPELQDYGAIAELTRKNLRRLLEHDKHIIVTATMRFDKPDPENGQTEAIVGPDLAGALFLGSMAMFDVVLCLRLKKVAGGTQRYFLTESEGAYRAKSRLTVGRAQVPVLNKEEIFDLKTGEGTFPRLLQRVQEKYEEAYNKVVA
jgi:hypothetical protein